MKAWNVNFCKATPLSKVSGMWRAFIWESVVRQQLLLRISPASLRVVSGLIALSFLGFPIASFADANAAKLSISATVIKHASLQVLAQPTSVVVTAADIARGYVDVTSPAQVAVQSNTASGYLLIFESQGEFMRQTLVKGLGTEVLLGTSGGGVTHRPLARGMSKTVHDLEFRFLLSNSAQQGLYAWPFSLSVMPL